MYHGGLGKEEDRLANSGHGQLEFERTQDIVLRHLPPPAVIADIGGGPGRYALWLAGLGYRVVHRDIVPLHVEQLRSAAGLGGAVESAVGDARSLDLADESVAAVLLLGPRRGGYTVYTHLPRRLQSEFGSAGLAVADLMSVEGAAFLLSDLNERMADPRVRLAILGARAHELVLQG